MTAPADLTVQVIGADAALTDMGRWAGELAGVVDKRAEPRVSTVADTVRARVPHLTGQLAGSVTVDDTGDGVAVAIGDGVPYAGWIEYGGTRGRPYMSSGRYLWPTATDAADDFYDLAADAAADSVGDFRWSTPTH